MHHNGPAIVGARRSSRPMVLVWFMVEDPESGHIGQGESSSEGRYKNETKSQDRLYDGIFKWGVQIPHRIETKMLLIIFAKMRNFVSL